MQLLLKFVAFVELIIFNENFSNFLNSSLLLFDKLPRNSLIRLFSMFFYLKYPDSAVSTTSCGHYQRVSEGEDMQYDLAIYNITRQI